MLPFDVGQYRFRRGGIGHVERHADAGIARLLEIGADLCGTFVRSGRADDGRAVRGQAQRDRASNAAGRSGDQRDLPCQMSLGHR